MIALDRVSKWYDRREGREMVLDRASAVLPEGGGLVIYGAPGTGKSTLLRLFAGTEKSDRGMVLRDGRISWPLGTMLPFVGAQTVRDNVRFLCRINGTDARRVLAETDQFGEFGRLLDEPFSRYAGPQRQKLMIGLWLALDYDCYLIDRLPQLPDGETQRRFRALAAERRRRAWIVGVEAKPGDLKLQFDRGAVLHDGKLTVYADLDRARAAYRAHELV
ncbi:MAG: ATP-binding cassette domain-containing protein [Alphaproteobacteria bacterium]